MLEQALSLLASAGEADAVRAGSVVPGGGVEVEGL